MAACVFIAAATISADVAWAPPIDLEALEPLWSGTKWIEKNGNDIIRLVEDARRAPVGVPSGPPAYEQPNDLMDAAGLGATDLPDVCPSNGLCRSRQGRR
jgi:hypothetical protein